MRGHLIYMKDLFGEDIKEVVLLKDKFLEVPVSILDTRSGNWKNRKNKWLRLGIKSNENRQVINSKKANDFKNFRKKKYEISGANEYFEKNGDVSIFNPALCELMYNWFCPDGGAILDPFAGGSVRGIVANYLGYKYTGIDIRQEQVDSNREQAMDILPIANQPQWYVGDSEDVIKDLNLEYDLVFSCPPYLNLEKYSEIENELSNLSDENFYIKYNEIIKQSISKLKKGCFFIFVIGEVSDSKGYQKNFIGRTKQILIENKLKIKNELIYITPIGIKAMAINRLMKTNKIIRIHENILICEKTF